jgi:hypothetical protein
MRGGGRRRPEDDGSRFRGRRRAVCLGAADVAGPSGLRCCSSRQAGSAQTRCAQTRAALIHLPLRCSPEPQQPPKDIPPTDVDATVCISPQRAQRLRPPQARQAVRAGRSLCAAEERSAIGCARSALQHLTRRSCFERRERSERSEFCDAADGASTAGKPRSGPAHRGRPARTACRALSAKPTKKSHPRTFPATSLIPGISSAANSGRSNA